LLDCLGAKYYENSIKSLGIDGKWVLYGLMTGPIV